MSLALSTGRMIELAVAVALLVAGLWFYRRRDPSDGSYGGQGAVIMFVIAAIIGAHAFGALDYHPTKAEADYYNARQH